MTFSMRTVIRPHLLLDVVTGNRCPIALLSSTATASPVLSQLATRLPRVLEPSSITTHRQPQSKTGATSAQVTVNGQPGQARSKQPAALGVSPVAGCGGRRSGRGALGHRSA